MKVIIVGFSIGTVLSNLIQLYSFIVLVWCLLSWFPNVRWYNQPFRTIDALVRPACAPFRKILPPINGIDLSPMIMMMTLMFIGNMVARFVP